MGVYEIKLPDVGEGVTEAELVEWFVEIGAYVREDDILASVMTDKATVEIPSPIEGHISWLGGVIGDTLIVGAPLIRLEVDGDGNLAAKEPEEKPALKDQPNQNRVKQAPSRSAEANASVNKVLAAPAIRGRAKALGLDLAEITGSGPDGRITHSDLDNFLQKHTPSVDDGAFQRAFQALGKAQSKALPLTGLRRKIAENMTATLRIPHITYVEEVDVTALEQARKSLNDVTQGGVKITPLAFLMRALALAIKDYPQVNGLYDDGDGVFHQVTACNIAIATDTEDGLITPVVHNVEGLNLSVCANEASKAAKTARDKKASRKELSGSTITITSLGAIGGIVTTPIINKPEVAIVGVNKIQTLPRWDGAKFEPRQIMNLSSSFDHRIIDGAVAAGFIQRVKALLEGPKELI